MNRRGRKKRRGHCSITPLRPSRPLRWYVAERQLNRRRRKRRRGHCSTTPLRASRSYAVQRIGNGPNPQRKVYFLGTSPGMFHVEHRRPNAKKGLILDPYDHQRNEVVAYFPNHMKAIMKPMIAWNSIRASAMIIGMNTSLRDDGFRAIPSSAAPAALP